MSEFCVSVHDDSDASDGSSNDVSVSSNISVFSVSNDHSDCSVSSDASISNDRSDCNISDDVSD